MGKENISIMGKENITRDEILLVYLTLDKHYINSTRFHNHHLKKKFPVIKANVNMHFWNLIRFT